MQEYRGIEKKYRVYQNNPVRLEGKPCPRCYNNKGGTELHSGVIAPCSNL